MNAKTPAEAGAHAATERIPDGTDKHRRFMAQLDFNLWLLERRDERRREEERRRWREEKVRRKQGAE